MSKLKKAGLIVVGFLGFIIIVGLIAEPVEPEPKTLAETESESEPKTPMPIESESESKMPVPAESEQAVEEPEEPAEALQITEEQKKLFEDAKDVYFKFKEKDDAARANLEIEKARPLKLEVLADLSEIMSCEVDDVLFGALKLFFEDNDLQSFIDYHDIFC